jgi:RNA polymerase sigma-54 factor
MAIGPRLDLRQSQSQSLVMTPQLRQAIKLLQFSNLEVAAFVAEEMERNPLLERDDSPNPPIERPALDQLPPSPAAPATGFEDAADPPDAVELVRTDILAAAAEAPLDADYAEPFDAGGPADGAPPPSNGQRDGNAWDGNAWDGNGWDGNGRGGAPDFGEGERDIAETVAAPQSLRESLHQQLRLRFTDASDRLIGSHLIALLEPSGRLGAAPEAIAQALGVAPERLEQVRGAMLRFEPTGMFARDLRECLAVQLAELNRLDPAMAALLDNLDLLARRDMRRLMALCGVDAADLADMVAELRRLDPKPGAAADAMPLQPVVPDILMRAAQDGGWQLELNADTLPRLLVNRQLSARIMPGASREVRSFVSEQLQTANWLVKSLQQRAQTILKVSAEIVRQQDGFFRHGIAHLRPIILRDIADVVEMHESTISRVTSGKYIATPRGVFELKYFFTTAIAATRGGESHSAEAVRHRIKAMVDAESPEDVLSDDAIVSTLRREGVDIARRTVAKYRDALRIPSSVQRKREKAVPA